MRINHNNIVAELGSTATDLDNLCIMAEGLIDWNKVPKQEILIVSERIKVIKAAINDLFNRLDSYATR